MVGVDADQRVRVHAEVAGDGVDILVGLEEPRRGGVPERVADDLRALLRQHLVDEAPEGLLWVPGLALVLASATDTTRAGLRSSSCFAQVLPGLSCRASRITDVAPTTSSRRIVPSPCLLMPPSRSLPPLE